jgi:colanic acid/amylovoran biosynthesis glycosyltransferase
MSREHSAQHTLLYFSPVAVTEPDAELLELPRRLLDGMCAFAELWDGLLVLVLPCAAHRDDNLDYVCAARESLPFDVRTLGDKNALRKWIHSAAMVYIPLVMQYIHLHALCRQANVPVVYDADYTLAIREAIVRIQTRNPILRWRRLLWLRQREPRLREMIHTAVGIQCLGTPAYETYASLNRSPLLYFDTRVRRDMLATPAQINARAQRLQSGAPLRLLFSGRWNAIKGVEDLPRVAAELRRRGVHFGLDILGGGALEKRLRRAVAEAEFTQVRVRGEYSFPELMRLAANECDLFICCHRQGDPSSTFVEMMSVGIPLIGYDQSGLRGLLALSQAGHATPSNNVTALAEQIVLLDREREILVVAARAAAEFTRDKSFEDMMSRRVAHLSALANNTILERASQEETMG